MSVAERLRVAALQEYELLDRPADAELEALVRVATAVADVPTATLNLIDSEYQCQLASVGFEGRRTPRSDSMCAISFRSGRTVHVPDARQEPMYADNPWVDGRLGAVRCYASVPLVNADGFALGTLCVFDQVERCLTDEQLARLRDLGTALVALFERRRQARRNAELAVEAQNQRAQLEAAHRELSDRRRELERSNAELAEFAAVASHDLRSPLGAIDGYLTLLLDVYGDDIPARGRDWVGVARTAVARMLSLTESLLSYARAGAATCEREPVDVAALVEQVSADLRNELRAVAATVEVQPSAPPVDADPVLLRQLLQNLVANAVKHRDPERACRIDVSVGTDDDGWVVAVADHGRGIPAEDRERVFAMFTRLDDAPPGGSGIGLATCTRIVDQHGGRIWIEDTPGGGATVCFFLPRIGADLRSGESRISDERNVFSAS
jgi:signal transduction histidine kinase